MTRLVARWLSPGDPTQRTGGYLYNARVVESLRAFGHDVAFVVLDADWPEPSADQRPGLARALETIPPGVPVVADGLCWPGLGEAGRALAARNPVVVLVHSPLAAETGLSPERARALEALETAAFAGTRPPVATSLQTFRALWARGVRPGGTLLPGTDPAPRARGGDGTRILTVATLTRRKGHDRLLDALAEVDAPWTLRCAGAPRDPAWAREVAARVEARGWSERVTFLGDLDGPALARELDGADLVAQPARYEAFGMAVAEAVARGLPVLTGPAGVVEHLPAGAVEVVTDDAGWAPALSSWLTDPAARAAAAERAWAAAAALPRWEDTVSGFIGMLGGMS